MIQLRLFIVGLLIGFGMAVSTAQTNMELELNRFIDSIEQEAGYTHLIEALKGKLSYFASCEPCLAKTYGRLGRCYCEIGDYDTGYVKISEAIQRRRALGDSLFVAGNLVNLSDCKKRAGAYAEALTHAFEAERIQKQLHDVLNINGITDSVVAKELANNYGLVSNIFADVELPRQGLAYAKQALKLREKIGIEEEIEHARFTLANRYFNLFQSLDSASFADSAEVLYRNYLNTKAFDTLDEAKTHHNLASLAISRKDYHRAWVNIQASEQLYNVIKNGEGIADVEVLKAHIYMEQPKRDYQKALTHLTNAQRMIETTEIDSSSQLEIFRLLADCYHLTQQRDSALKYLQLAESVGDRLYLSQQKRLSEVIDKYYNENAALQKTKSDATISKKETEKRLFASIAAILLLLLMIGALIWRNRDQRQRSRLAAQNQAIEDTLKQAQLRFLQGIIEGQETERNETKHILHNDIVNTVIALSYEMESSTNSQTAEHQSWIAQLRKLAAHTRKLSHQKGGLINDIGLAEGIKDLFNRISKTKQISAEFSGNIQTNRIPTVIEIELWHIVQELVGNTLKYAQATQIELSIDADTDGIYLTYSDNGRGFDYQKAITNSQSLGLQNIIEKTQNLGGLPPEIITSNGHGLTFSLHIPASKTDIT